MFCFVPSPALTVISIWQSPDIEYEPENYECPASASSAHSQIWQLRAWQPIECRAFMLGGDSGQNHRPKPAIPQRHYRSESDSTRHFES
jgi:hypothetical protein